jgi:hypothetical protein
MALPQISVWEVNTTLGLQGNLHDLPKKEVEYLPKFNGEGHMTTFVHIGNYDSKLYFLNITHDDIVY